MLSEPFLGVRKQQQDLTRTEINLVFGVLGLCSSILWNQLLLSVGLLVKLFGDSAISIACTSQNVLCGLVMWVLTFAPASVAMEARGGDQHRARSIMLLAAAVLCMLGLGTALSATLVLHRLPMWLFVVLVALDGAATGTAQIVGASLGGMLSGANSDAAAALLVGEAAAPLLAALCAALISLAPTHDDEYQRTLVALPLPMSVLLLALVALRTLYRAKPPGGVPLECQTLGITGSKPEGTSFIRMRVRQLLPSAACVCACCFTWIFFLCSAPAVAAGLCGTPPTAAQPSPPPSPASAALVGEGGGQASDCVAAVSSLMVGVSNVAAFTGRLVGGVLPPGCSPTWMLSLETIVMVLLGFGAILMTEARSEGLAEPAVVGGALSAGLTLWCNCLLMRLSAAAQKQAGTEHSILCPCPITAQISWVAIQTGCLGGSLLSFVLKAAP